MISRAVLLICLALLAGCGKTPGAALTATNVEVTQAMPGMTMSAGYLTLINNSDDSIEITRITSPQFESVEMHESVIENDVARMQRLEILSIESGQTMRLERGGKHLMLMDPTGSGPEVTLNLYAGDALLLSVETTINGDD